VVAQYHRGDTQSIVQAAARLVDDGLAGTLSRVQELERFILDRDYAKVGLAYCSGMENEARQILDRLRGRGIRAVAVSCTVGGLAQAAINEVSSKPGVSCNPLTQAAQLEAEGVDLAVIVGLCLGHDILFTKAFRRDQTTLVVKDRVRRSTV
jgi:uncharacterized metal-binding protein